jgi:hypothetical protein
MKREPVESGGTHSSEGRRLRRPSLNQGLRFRHGPFPGGASTSPPTSVIAQSELCRTRTTLPLSFFEDEHEDDDEDESDHAAL